MMNRGEIIAHFPPSRCFVYLYSPDVWLVFTDNNSTTFWGVFFLLLSPVRDTFCVPLTPQHLKHPLFKIHQQARRLLYYPPNTHKGCCFYLGVKGSTVQVESEELTLGRSPTQVLRPTVDLEEEINLLCKLLLSCVHCGSFKLSQK